MQKLLNLFIITQKLVFKMTNSLGGTIFLPFGEGDEEAIMQNLICEEIVKITGFK